MSKSIDKKTCYGHLIVMSMALFEENLEIRSTACFISPRLKTKLPAFRRPRQIIESRMPMDYRLGREGNASTPFFPLAERFGGFPRANAFPHNPLIQFSRGRP
jgi:hypothetical protein